MKTGLIMEGGAMRGLFTCGIIDVFMENGIVFGGISPNDCKSVRLEKRVKKNEG